MDEAGRRAGPAATGALIALIALAVFLNYVDRGAIGIAAPVMKSDLALSATQFGLAVSAFFWLYGPLQPLLGWLCDRWSVYRLFGLAVAVWAVSTALIGWVGGLTGLIVLRIALGLGEGFVFPCSSKLIAWHVPAERRGLANAAVAVGIALGPAAGTLAGGAILAGYGWRAIFVVFGLATLLWLLPWAVAVRALPRQVRQEAAAPVGYGVLLRQKALWIMGATHVTANFAFFFVAAWLPLYLVQARGLSVTAMATATAAMFAMQALSSLAAGHVSDRLVRAGHDADRVRRGFCAASQIGLGAGIAAVALAQGEAALIAALVFTGLAGGPGPALIYVMAQTFAGPRHAGSWVGIQNAIGSLSGIVGPVVTGLIVDATGGYGGAFAFAAAVSALGAVLFALAIPPIRQIEALA